MKPALYLRPFLGFALVFSIALTACSKPESPAPAKPIAAAERPSIILITLDTTRADSIGPEASDIVTPSFNSIAESGRRFTQAYAPVPETFPSHVSMMTGLYPAGHGIHENGRYLSRDQTLLAEQLRRAGYHTAAFVSAFSLAGQFGLARGFDTYDDAFESGREERSAKETTDRALDFLGRAPAAPLFLWVHYYDPHYPYEPPEPFRSRYAAAPYLGEIASMDQELGRLVKGIQEKVAGPVGMIVVGDHGEGLGDHGEYLHGNLLYQSTMHVPLLVSGPGVAPGVSESPVSIRRVFQTVRDWAGLGAEKSLRRSEAEVVLGEAMKPFLQYGWQPQTMAVDGPRKFILAGGLETYDVIDDPGEKHDLGDETEIPREVRKALGEYPVPLAETLAETPPPTKTLGDEERRRLASLGYVVSDAKPVVRKDAPRPADMTHLFGELDRASGLFVREEYVAAIPPLEKILAADPHNLTMALHLAVAHSILGHDDAALAAFRRAEAIAPGSSDVRQYLALHYTRTGEWDHAVPLLENVLAKAPDRLPALEALQMIREHQGKLAEALSLEQRIVAMKAADPSGQIHLGELAMATGNTPIALTAFENARNLQGAAFDHDLELGVLYIDAGRLDDARDALDRVPASHPRYPMALFKRAQVSVLLREPDAATRIEEARKHADATTRPLIEREKLFEGM